MTDGMHTRTEIMPTAPGGRPVGSAPGTLMVPHGSPKPVITARVFGESFFSVVQVEHPSELARFHTLPHNVWINVVGLGDAEVIQSIADVMGFHRLATEDVMHLAQRPKIEDYGTYLFATALLPLFQPDREFEQVSLFIGPQLLVTFQAFAPDQLQPLADRLQEGRAGIRSLGPGYLGYAVLDLIVDAYFPVLEAHDEEVEQLELSMHRHADLSPMRQIYRIKRVMMAIRRSMWGMRDSLSQLSRDGHALLPPEVLPYLRDTYDHSLRVMEMAENLRELATELTDMHYAHLSQKLNEVMKVLTIISTIFIPLTFIVGVYGMNFDHMPELRWKFGYAFVWGIMITVGFLLNWFFRRKGWIGRKARE